MAPKHSLAASGRSPTQKMLSRRNGLVFHSNCAEHPNTAKLQLPGVESVTNATPGRQINLRLEIPAGATVGQPKPPYS